MNADEPKFESDATDELAADRADSDGGTGGFKEGEPRVDGIQRGDKLQDQAKQR